MQFTVYGWNLQFMAVIYNLRCRKTTWHTFAYNALAYFAGAISYDLKKFITLAIVVGKLTQRTSVWINKVEKAREERERERERERDCNKKVGKNQDFFCKKMKFFCQQLLPPPKL